MIILNTAYKASLSASFASRFTGASNVITIYSDTTDRTTLNTNIGPATGRLIEYNGVGLTLRNGFIVIGALSTTAQSAKATGAGTAKYFHIRCGGEWLCGEIGAGHALQLDTYTITVNSTPTIVSFAFKF